MCGNAGLPHRLVRFLQVEVQNTLLSCSGEAAHGHQWMKGWSGRQSCSSQSTQWDARASRVWTSVSCVCLCNGAHTPLFFVCVRERGGWSYIIPLSHSLTHSLSYSLSPSLILTLTLSLHSFSLTLCHSLSHSISPSHSLTHSLTQSRVKEPRTIPCSRYRRSVISQITSIEVGYELERTGVCGRRERKARGTPLTSKCSIMWEGVGGGLSATVTIYPGSEKSMSFVWSAESSDTRGPP